MQIIWTKHAEQRLKEWEQKRQITRTEIERVVLLPDQLVCGDLNILVAQSRSGAGLSVSLSSKHIWVGEFSPSTGQARCRNIGGQINEG